MHSQIGDLPVNLTGTHASRKFQACRHSRFLPPDASEFGRIGSQLVTCVRHHRDFGQVAPDIDGGLSDGEFVECLEIFQRRTLPALLGARTVSAEFGGGPSPATSASWPHRMRPARNWPVYSGSFGRNPAIESIRSGFPGPAWLLIGSRLQIRRSAGSVDDPGPPRSVLEFKSLATRVKFPSPTRKLGTQMHAMLSLHGTST